MPDFRKVLASGDHILLDGSIGVLLQSRGCEPGRSPEAFGLENPGVLEGIYADYLAAGARVLTTNTFGGTRFKLPDGSDVRGINEAMAGLARRAAGDRAFVAGCVGPTGHFIEPLGSLTMADLVNAYREQIEGLVAGGSDLILAETHFDLAEVRAVVMAARQVTDLPVGVSMTFEAGVSLTGTTPAIFADTMQNMGVDFVGSNCGTGPDGMIAGAEAMLARLHVPLLIQPNAGLPELEDGRTVFRLGPQEFVERMLRLADMGVKLLGGCCGTTPAHIGALGAALSGRSWTRPEPVDAPAMTVTSRGASVAIDPARRSVLIGERINPTGKKQLAAELQQGELTEALAIAGQQIERGAAVLDVNVGAPMVDEAVLLPELTRTLTARFGVPLCLDSVNIEAVERSLAAYPASPLVNSISGEPGRMEALGPLCRLHGAPFILLPLRGRKLPVTAAERIGIIEELLGQAFDLGIPKRLIMVDVLALTVSSKPEAALACLETIRYCRDKWGLPTVMGLSNISFGLPARELVNSTFLAMCMAAGLSAFIANPDSVRLREARYAAEVLLARDPQAGEFIQRFAAWTPGAPGAAGTTGGQAPAAPAEVRDLGEAVVLGARDRILAMVEAALAEGRQAFDLLNRELIPAIMRVGEKYERKEYFLPQLLLSAETMQLAFERLRPLLAEDTREGRRPVAVMATVEGDIHDIGKNIVCLMLRNHGFDVVDLGKDVAAETIVNRAQEAGADLIGLSALMTTTMVRMKDTVDLVRERKLGIPVMIGGAVVTQAFASSIGADGYATDAVGAVRMAGELLARPVSPNSGDPGAIRERK